MAILPAGILSHKARYLPPFFDRWCPLQGPPSRVLLKLELVSKAPSGSIQTRTDDQHLNSSSVCSLIRDDLLDIKSFFFAMNQRPVGAVVTHRISIVTTVDEYLETLDLGC